MAFEPLDGLVRAEFAGSPGDDVVDVSGPVATGDWWVNPADGDNANSGTSESSPLASLGAFGANGSKSLSANETVVLVANGTDTPAATIDLSGASDVTFAVYENNTSDYIINGEELSAGDDLLVQTQCSDFNWLGTSTSGITFRNVPNVGMRQVSNGGSVSGSGVHRHVRVEDTGDDASGGGGHAIVLGEGIQDTRWFDCAVYDASVADTSAGWYVTGPSTNRSGGHRWVRCTASYVTDAGWGLGGQDAANPSTFVDCDSHHHGKDQDTWWGNTSVYGEGVGFRLGGAAGGDNWLYRCAAWKNQGIAGGSNTGIGFDDNGTAGNWVLNATDWDAEQTGFQAAGSDTHYINCLSHDTPTTVAGSPTDENNSWDLSGVSVSDTDFVIFDDDDPDHLRPRASSDLVDAGVILGGYTTEDGITIDLTADPPTAISETYDGATPDLGGIESGASETASTTNRVFTNTTKLKNIDTSTDPFAAQLSTLTSGSGQSRATKNPTLESVMDDDNSAHSYNPHRFVADTNNRADYRAAVRMGERARDSALAYWFTGEDGFARAAVDCLVHWCLKSSTYMIPRSDIPNASGAIRQTIWIPNLVYAASFVQEHPRWGEYSGETPWKDGDAGDAETAFKQWIADWFDGGWTSGTHANGIPFEESEPAFCPTNNRWPWRICTRAAFAAYLDRSAQMQTAKDAYRAMALTTCPDGTDSKPYRPWDDYINDDIYNNDPQNQAFFNADLSRDDSFAYTGFNLLAMTNCLTIFEAWDGTDFWDFNISGKDDFAGSSIRKALDWQDFVDAVTNPGGWPHNEGGETTSRGEVEQAATVYELAHSRYPNDSTYDSLLDTDAYNLNGRPHWDRRLLGPATLIHGAP